jgi:hypothetical protein
MFEVIICALSTGRVRRKSFDNFGQAEQYAAAWRAKNGLPFPAGCRCVVELVRHDPPASTPPSPAPAGVAA